MSLETNAGVGGGGVLDWVMVLRDDICIYCIIEVHAINWKINFKISSRTYFNENPIPDTLISNFVN